MAKCCLIKLSEDYYQVCQVHYYYEFGKALLKGWIPLKQIDAIFEKAWLDGISGSNDKEDIEKLMRYDCSPLKRFDADIYIFVQEVDEETIDVTIKREVHCEVSEEVTDFYNVL